MPAKPLISSRSNRGPARRSAACFIVSMPLFASLRCACHESVGSVGVGGWRLGCQRMSLRVEGFARLNELANAIAHPLYPYPALPALL